MRHGFIKVAAATPDIRVADVDYNKGQIIKQMDEAAEAGAKIIVFPELCITGYTCSDLFLQDILLSSSSFEPWKYIRFHNEELSAQLWGIL